MAARNAVGSHKINCLFQRPYSFSIKMLLQLLVEALEEGVEYFLFATVGDQAQAMVSSVSCFTA